VKDFRLRFNAGYTGTIPLGGRTQYLMHSEVNATTKLPPAESPTNTTLSGLMSVAERMSQGNEKKNQNIGFVVVSILG